MYIVLTDRNKQFDRYIPKLFDTMENAQAYVLHLIAGSILESYGSWKCFREYIKDSEPAVSVINNSISWLEKPSGIPAGNVSRFIREWSRWFGEDYQINHIDVESNLDFEYQKKLLVDNLKTEVEYRNCGEGI